MVGLPFRIVFVSSWMNDGLLRLFLALGFVFLGVLFGRFGGGCFLGLGGLEFRVGTPGGLRLSYGLVDRVINLLLFGIHL
jgi:hypothetical protein